MMSASEKPTQPVKAAENDRTQAELASMRDEQPADELDPVEECSTSWGSVNEHSDVTSCAL